MSTIAKHKENLPGVILKAVIIYDDFDSATHATALLERVARRVDEAIKWDIKPWRNDVLKQPTLAALTVAVAANADVIVLALNHIHAPPPELSDWLKNWAAHRRIRDAAVLSLHIGTSHSQSKSWNEIKTLVEAHDLTFLGGHQVWHNDRPAPFAHRWQQRKQLVAPAPRPSFAEWLPVPHP
ncbi:MAG: hypothetical protein ACLPRE_14605 [Limisphaerales bacterium]